MSFVTVKCPNCTCELELLVDVIAHDRQLSIDESQLRLVESGPVALAKAAIERVAIRRDVSMDALEGRSKAAPIVAARQEAMHAAREDAGASYEQIGELLNRDHSTITMGIRSHLARVGDAA